MRELTNREKASENLNQAENVIGETLVNDFPATAALIGIGYALLELADAERDRTMEIAGGLKGNRM